MTIRVINPATGETLERGGESLSDASGNSFPIVAGVPRICPASNYTDNFGKQWNLFRTTQIDREADGLRASEQRFFAETGWPRGGLEGEDVLEVGSGAGRFSRVVLAHTRARPGGAMSAVVRAVKTR